MMDFWTLGRLERRSETAARLARDSAAVVDLLLKGYVIADISAELKMKRRTVKARLQRLYANHGITSGIKHIQLTAKFFRPSAEQMAMPATLSKREREIIALVSYGLDNKQIAQMRRTSEHVIKNYLRTIYDKTGTWNRGELAIWYWNSSKKETHVKSYAQPKERDYSGKEAQI